jgi:hypothetical protein
MTRAVASSEATVAHVSPQASDPANSAFFGVIVGGRIAFNTVVVEFDAPIFDESAEF